MEKFKNLPLTTKLLLGCGCVVLVAAIGLVVAVFCTGGF